jgi:AbrB family looped-hinge helix DNA binding protein
MQLTLDKFGRMVLPKAIREDLNLEPGVPLEVEKGEECIVLRPVRESDLILQKDGLLVFSGHPTEDLEEALHNLRQRRLKEAVGLW